MAPTLQNHDLILVNKWSTVLVPGDVVVFNMPQHTSTSLIKRIVASPHSTAYIDDFRLYINDKLVVENKGDPLLWNTHAFDCRYSEILKSAANEFIVLGDNRCHSTDSRDFGAVSKENIVGKVFGKLRLPFFHE